MHAAKGYWFHTARRDTRRAYLLITRLEVRALPGEPISPNEIRAFRNPTRKALIDFCKASHKASHTRFPARAVHHSRADAKSRTPSLRMNFHGKPKRAKRATNFRLSPRDNRDNCDDRCDHRAIVMFVAVVIRVNLASIAH